MSRQRLLLGACWVLTTMVATFVSGAGVSLVTRDVTDPHTPVLASTDVIALLAGPAADVARPSSTTTSTVAPTSWALPTVVPTSEAPSVPPPPTEAPPPPAAPVTAPPPAAPDVGGGVVETFTSAGGSVSLACFGDAIVLLSGRPHDGYRLVVGEDGPERVAVRFDGGDHTTHDRLWATCRDGAPARHGEHDERDGGDRGGDHGSRGDDRDDRRDGDGDRDDDGRRER